MVRGARTWKMIGGKESSKTSNGHLKGRHHLIRWRSLKIMRKNKDNIKCHTNFQEKWVLSQSTLRRNMSSNSMISIVSRLSIIVKGIPWPNILPPLLISFISSHLESKGRHTCFRYWFKFTCSEAILFIACEGQYKSIFNFSRSLLI